MFKNNKDIHFVNSLYGQANEKIPFRLDILFIAIVAFFLMAIFWASYAQIDELARGPGKVIPASKIQAIQNLDGGVVSEILIKEGERVEKDQPLMRIDTIRFEASLEENSDFYQSLLAKKARLVAELKFDIMSDISSRVEFPSNANISIEYKNLESKLFENRISEYTSSIRTLKFQLLQKRQELKEIESKEIQLQRSLELLDQQKDTIRKMVNSGSKSNMELLKIENSYNETRGQLEGATLSIPRSKLAIAESKSKMEEKTNTFRAESAKQLQEVESELRKIGSRLISDKDKLDKTIVRSPVDGIIKQININTVGGVVKSGDTLIEIVPNSQVLLIEAKIDPKDIAFINPTQKVIVKLTAYDFSIYGALEGEIVEISADSIKDTDSKEGKSYYKVVVRTEKNYLEYKGKKLPIIPGMITSVDIITGKKTIMDFLLKPIIKTKQEAMHER